MFAEIARKRAERTIQRKMDSKNLLEEVLHQFVRRRPELIKQFIKTKVPSSSLIVKSKNANSAFEIKGIKIKHLVGDEEIDIEFVEEEESVDVKKKKPKKKFNYYFNENMDKIILTDYEDIEKDIMMISEVRNIRPWQVVSVLMRHNVISKRNDSRGYDKYKETDEYKSKIKE
jgi:hypothetical protein